MTSKKLLFHAISWVSSHIWFSDIAIALLGLFIFTSILQRLSTKGPMLWPLMGIAPTFLFHVSDIYGWITKSLIQAGGSFHYTGICLGGLYGIITVDPSNIEYILKTKFKTYPKGEYYRERFHDLLGDGIFNADDELWKDQRRIATSEMHASRFVEYSMKTIEDLVHQKMLQLIEKLAKDGDFIDLQEMLLRFTFDNICTAAFGIDPGCLGLDLPEVPFAKAFEDATELTLFRFLVPPFVWKPMKFLGVGTEKKLKEAVQIVHDFVAKTVMDRRIELCRFGSINDRADLLSRLIEIENEGKNRFPNNFIRDFCISFILAGRDTSSVGLAWFFWLLHKNPQVESKILSEIKEILGHRANKKDPIDDNGIIFTVEELQKMVYLQAALSESLRLYPPVPIDFKFALENDVLPDGTAVKKGARILFCMFSMARMESIWGKDCLEFKPERWIKDGQFVSENQFKYVVFNGGPRLCAGKKFAYNQMKMVAASILLRYSVKVVENQNVVPKITTTLYMKNGLLVTFKPRSSSQRYVDTLCS